jgi:hypothetical protein
MYYHLFTFGDSGIVNGTDNNVNSQRRIQFVSNLSISFDSFGVFIIIINIANLAYSLG